MVEKKVKEEEKKSQYDRTVFFKRSQNDMNFMQKKDIHVYEYILLQKEKCIIILRKTETKDVYI